MMKKHSKRIFILCFCMALVLGLSTTVLAATYYKNHYTNGSLVSSFQITTSGSVSHFTVQTQDFPSGTSVNVEVWNKAGTTKISQSNVFINGNGKIENQALKLSYPAGTYTIKYNVLYSGSGWIGVWLY